MYVYKYILIYIIIIVIKDSIVHHETAIDSL